jgi:hypothetical protein
MKPPCRKHLFPDPRHRDKPQEPSAPVSPAADLRGLVLAARLYLQDAAYRQHVNAALLQQSPAALYPFED